MPKITSLAISVKPWSTNDCMGMSKKHFAQTTQIYNRYEEDCYSFRKKKLSFFNQSQKKVNLKNEI